MRLQFKVRARRVLCSLPPTLSPVSTPTTTMSRLMRIGGSSLCTLTKSSSMRLPATLSRGLQTTVSVQSPLWSQPKSIVALPLPYWPLPMAQHLTRHLIQSLTLLPVHLAG